MGGRDKWDEYMATNTFCQSRPQIPVARFAAHTKRDL